MGERSGGAPHGQLVQIVAAVLAHRLAPSLAVATGLYQADFASPQIALFDKLAADLPLVSVSSELVHRLIVGFCDDQDEASIIDIGTGTGRQIVALLEGVARRPCRPRLVRIVAIEPSPSSLMHARACAYAAAMRLVIELEYHAVLGHPGSAI